MPLKYCLKWYKSDTTFRSAKQPIFKEKRMKENTIDHVLGKEISDYRTTYDPAILVRVPRSENRKIYEIDEKRPPFVGFDTWHAYEVSFLTDKGLPVNGLLKLKVPASSQFIVESKSFKLYLFSFNMEKLGAETKEATERFTQTVSSDLKKLLLCPVELHFFYRSEAKELTKESSLKKAEELGTLIDLDSLEFTEFNENPQILQEGPSTHFFIRTDLLRSNCRITHQPDWGSLYIHFKGKEGLSLESLAQYIVSFRGENHFHEEIVECLYKRLMDRYKPGELMVTALYTRRGGIDICPVRASRETLYPTVLGDVRFSDVKDYRQ